MATKWISPTWRMPEESNQSKFSNYSMSFDGSQYVDTNQSLSSSYSALTLSAWVNYTSLSSLTGTIFGQWIQNNNSGSTLVCYTVSNKIKVYLGPSATFLTSTTTLSTGTWYNVILRFDGSTMKLYINGTEEDSIAFTAINNSTQNLILGAYSNSGQTGYQSFLNGKLDHCCVFDYALSQAQINYLYNSGTPQNPMAISGNAPIAYYDLGGSSTGDAAAASPNTLTVPNSSVPSATVFDFDGTLDFIEVPNSSSLQITDNLTLSCWINVNDVTINNNILDKYYDGTTDGRSYLLRVQASRIYLFLANASGTVGVSYISNSILQNNTWYHITTTFSSTGEANKQVKIYINGSLDAEHAKTDLIASNDEEFRIGSSYNTSNRFGGKISNAQVFNTALPATGSNSVETLYNYGTPLSDMSGFTSLQGWWRMNVDTSNWDGSNWIIEDSSIPYNGTVNFKI